MKILHISPGHNATASLFEDGKCLRYLHEEKFNNQKNYWGYPAKSIDYLDKKFGLQNLDYIVFPSKQLLWGSMPLVDNQISYEMEKFGISKIRQLTDLLEYRLRWKFLFSYFRSFVLDTLISTQTRKSMRAYLSKKYNIKSNRIVFLDHHICHALSPVHFYNLHQKRGATLIFTLDGAGDNLCSRTAIYHPKNNHLELISKSNFDSSIGLLYSGLTKFLGMKPVEHEYKVMGLAAYVSEEKYYQPILDKLRKIIYYDKKENKFKSSFNTNFSYYYFRDNFVGYRFDSIAAAVQKLTEELVMTWIKANVKKYKIKNIACVGGVFMNVKLNKKIQEMTEINEVYFMPSGSDDSLGYGAVYDLFSKNGIIPNSNASMYQGLEYSNKEILSYIEKNHLKKEFKVVKCRNVEEKIAQLLSEKQIVAWFNGAGEWGSRSLGNRSILADASDYASYNEVNNCIKMRDFWMPFAPVILFERAKDYIANWDKLETKIKDSSKYMITAFDTTVLGQKHLMAALHQKDKTIRPQLVEKHDNPSLYKLLKLYEDKSGVGALMNTSLNIHGFPLVGSLDQAIFTIKNSKLKYLAINNFLLIKK